MLRLRVLGAPRKEGRAPFALALHSDAFADEKGGNTVTAANGLASAIRERHRAGIGVLSFTRDRDFEQEFR
jgi:hypothetical protein